MLVDALEQAEAGVRTLVAEEYRDLLTKCVTRIFSNLFVADEDFDFTAVMQPITPKESRLELTAMLQSHLLAIVDAYQRPPKPALVKVRRMLERKGSTRGPPTGPALTTRTLQALFLLCKDNCLAACGSLPLCICVVLEISLYAELVPW